MTKYYKSSTSNLKLTTRNFILHLSLITFIFSLLSSCSTNTKETAGFELKGKLSDASGETLFLVELSPQGIKTIDSTKLNENGEFSFRSIKPELGFYNLKITDANFATLILDSTSKINLTGNAKDLGNTYKVSGSEDTQLFLDLNEVSKKNYRQRDSLSRVFQVYVNSIKMDKKKMDSLSAAIEIPFNKIADEQNNYLTQFIDKHASSLASLAAIQQLPSDNFFSYYKKVDDALENKYPNSTYVKLFHESVEQLEKLQPGSIAPDFTLNTPEDKPVSLSSLKGKIVLIDFWASWCAPCRAELPNLVKLYAKYKNEDFEILSVSLDKDKTNWTKAIKEEKLTWINVSDLKFWDSQVVKLYNFNSIPLTYLIDKEGKIIASHLQGEDLEKKLDEIMK